MSLKSIGTLNLILGEIRKSGIASASSIDLLTLSMKGLNEEQIATIVSASGLTAAQIKTSLSAAGASEAVILEKLAMMGFSKEAAIAAVVSDTFSKEQAEAAASTLAFTGSVHAASGATMGLSSAFSAFGAVIKAHPILFTISALLAIVPLAIKLFDHFTVSAEEAAETMKNAAQEVESFGNTLTSLHNELDTTKNRIKELEELAENGRLTPDQTTELADLKATNEELERKILLNEKLEAQAKTDADEAAITSYGKNRYMVVTTPDTYSENFASYGKQNGVEALQLYIDAMQKVKKQQDELNDSFANGSISTEDYTIKFNELQEEYDYLSGEAANVAKDQRDVSNSISGTTDEAIALKKSIDDVLLTYSLFDSDKSTQFKRLTGLSEYKEAVDELKRLGSSGQLSVANVSQNELFGDFLEKAHELDITTDDVVNYFNAFQNGAANSASRMQKLTDSVANYQVKTKAIYASKGNVDLLNRNVVSIDSDNIGVVQKYDPYSQSGDKMTVLSKTYEDGKKAIVVTPILPNGQILSEDELEKYVNKVIAATKKAKDGDYAAHDQKGIILNVFGDHTDFERNNAEAEIFAERLHEIHAAMLEAQSDQELDELITELAKLTEYNPSMAALSEKFADVESKFDNLGKGLKEFRSDGLISLQTLAKIGEDFGDQESFDRFAKTLLDSKSTMAEAQAAANALAAEYLNSAEALDLLTAGNRKEVETLLEGIGVTNAAEVVESRLLGLRMQAKVETMGLANETWTVVEARLKEAGATETEIAALLEYRQTVLKANVATQDFIKSTASETAALLKQAQAAGASAKVIGKLLEIQRLQSERASGKSVQYYGERLELLQKQIQEEIDSTITNASVVLPEVKVTVPNSGSTSKTESEFDKAYKYHQHLLAMNQESLQEYIEWLDEAYQKAFAKGSDEFNKYEEEVLKKSIEWMENLRKELENSISLNQNWLDRAVPEQNYDKIRDYTGTIIDEYRKMQESVHKQAEYYRVLGYSDTSDEVKELSLLWWDYEDAIVEVTKSAWNAIVENANDALDSIQNVYDTFKNAAQQTAERGSLSVDTFQDMLDLGVEYLGYLDKENGQLVLNKDAVERVIAAKTEQMAVETALAYIESVRAAKNSGNIAELERLTLTTELSSKATWDLVYAQAALLKAEGLSDEYYRGMMNNIEKLRLLAQDTKNHIGDLDTALKDTLDNAKSSLDDILKYVEEMIKQETQNQIKALEDQVDAMKNYVDLQKKSLDLERARDDYTKSVSEKVKELAEIQGKIAMLDLDNSRAAQAEKAQLQERFAELQESLAEIQADRAYEVTTDALDDMYDAYSKEKDQEIATLEDSISSEEKLYQKAIARIDQGWDALYKDLRNWNYQYGSETQATLDSCWEAASQAVREYGNYLTAVEEITRRIASIDTSSSWNIGGNSKIDGGSSQQTTTDNIVRTKVSQMQQNSTEWHTNVNARSSLERKNETLADEIEDLIGRKVVKENGVWYLDRVGGTKLYDAYSTYHSGTSSVGGGGSLKQDETFAKLQKGEMVLPEKEQNAVYRLLEFGETMIAKYGELFGMAADSDLSAERMQEQIKTDVQSVQNNVDNYQNSMSITVPVQIHTVQKLDEAEIKQLSRRIGKDTISTINNEFFKSGKRTGLPILKP